MGENKTPCAHRDPPHIAALADLQSHSSHRCPSCPSASIRNVSTVPSTSFRGTSTSVTARRDTPSLPSKVSRRTGGSSEETKERKKSHNLSAYHILDLPSCIRSGMWSASPLWQSELPYVLLPTSRSVKRILIWNWPRSLDDAQTSYILPFLSHCLSNSSRTSPRGRISTFTQRWLLALKR